MTELEAMEVHKTETPGPVFLADDGATWGGTASGPDPMQTRKGQNFSVASMVLGIVSIVMAWPFGIICGVLGIVFSQISKKALGYLNGKARAGLICGIIGVCLFLLLMVVIIAAYIFMFSAMMQEVHTF